MSHFDESNMIGTFEMSGSDAINIKKRTIASLDSSMPSSILMSIICAPFSTCCFATSNAASKLPSIIKRLNAAEPVTFVRSPTFTNKLSAVMFNGSKPDKPQCLGISGIWRGGNFSTALTMARIVSGDVPQHPPMIFK